MATSGSYNFTVTRDDIITAAYRHINVIGEVATPSASQVTAAAVLLNLLIKSGPYTAMPLWALKRGTILPFSGSNTINTDSHVVTNYDTTTLTADSAATDTTLTVDSITGFSASDQIGIELDDGSIDWTTVSGAPAGSTITIATGVTSAASTGNRIYGYTASSERIQKPIRIIEANLKTVSSGASREILIEDRTDYYNLGNRTTEGEPTMIYYDIASSSATNLDNGTIAVWPRFANGDSVIEFTYQRPFQDFDSSTDDPDFPQAYFMPLMLDLAATMGIKYSVPKDKRDDMRQEAKYWRDEALATTDSVGSVQFIPETR